MTQRNGAGSVSAALEHPPTDPLLAALIDKLPASGTSWPTDRRHAWLQMMAMAFDVVYGPAEGDAAISIPVFLKPKETPSEHQLSTTEREAIIAAMERGRAGDGVYSAADLGKPRVADQRYLVDRMGIAFGPKGQIDPHDIPAGEPLWDFRPGEPELDVIDWASGRVELHALPALTVMRG